MEAVVRHSVENQRNIYGVVKMVQTLPTDRAVQRRSACSCWCSSAPEQGVDNHRAGMAKPVRPTPAVSWARPATV
jgi:hypothetical protein